MSAAIHHFPGRDPNVDLRLPAGDAGEDLLAELGAAVRATPVAVGGARDHDGVPGDVGVGPTSGPLATVTPIAGARRHGANDLVVAEPIVDTELRRDRLLLVVGVLGLALVLAMIVGVFGAGADGDVPIAEVTTMEDGDTLWGLARDITPVGGDVRTTVALLLDVNDFSSPTVPVGTPVRLPELGG